MSRASERGIHGRLDKRAHAQRSARGTRETRGYEIVLGAIFSPCRAILGRAAAFPRTRRNLALLSSRGVKELSVFFISCGVCWPELDAGAIFSEGIYTRGRSRAAGHFFLLFSVRFGC